MAKTFIDGVEVVSRTGALDKALIEQRQKKDEKERKKRNSENNKLFLKLDRFTGKKPSSRIQAFILGDWEQWETKDRSAANTIVNELQKSNINVKVKERFGTKGEKTFVIEGKKPEGWRPKSEKTITLPKTRRDNPGISRSNKGIGR